jgi:hypothetical protein
LNEDYAAELRRSQALLPAVRTSAPA